MKKIISVIVIFNFTFLSAFAEISNNMRDGIKTKGKIKMRMQSMVIRNGKLQKVERNRKNNDRFIKDEAGRIVRILSKERGVIEINYDDYGRIRDMKYSDGRRIEYHYDILGRKIRTVYKSKSEKDIVDYKYDTREDSYELGKVIEERNNIERMSLFYKGDRLRSIIKEINGRKYLIKYKKSGREKEITYPSGIKIMEKYERNEDGEVLRKIIMVKDKKERVIYYKGENVVRHLSRKLCMRLKN